MQRRALTLAVLATSLLVSNAQAQLGTPTGSFPVVVASGIPVGIECDATSLGGPSLLLTGIGANDTLDRVDLTGVSLATVNVGANTPNPIGVTRDLTRIYITDSTDDDVDLYDLGGNYVSSFSVAAETTFPEGITYNPNTDLLYVVDGAGANEVEIYDKTGAHQGSFPILGSSPDGIAYDADLDGYWVYDSGTAFARLYDVTGGVIAAFAAPTGCEGVALVGRTLHLCQTGTDTILQFDVDTALIPSQLSAVAEATLNTGTLSVDPVQSVTDNDWVRIKMSDVTGTQTGNLCAIVANVGGSSLPTGVTATIPGFNQLWAGSTPAGFQVTLPPFLVGNEYSFQVGPAFLSADDRIRIQGLNFAPSVLPLPVVATSQTIVFKEPFPCLWEENFDTVAEGNGNYPLFWSTGVGGLAWDAEAGTTTSGNTGPNAATSGNIYMYCETSSPNSSGNFLMNSPVYPSAGIGNMKFDLSRVGATIGTLHVRVGPGDGTFSATPVATFTGPGTAEWETVVLALTGLGVQVQFQFDYTGGGSFTGDLAIDSFCLLP